MGSCTCRRTRASVVTLLTLALATGLAVGVAGARASTVTVEPNTPVGGTQAFPFGSVQFWPPHLGFVYKNVPAFQLKANDKLAFDLSSANNVPIQYVIELAPTTANGGDTPAGSYTAVVPNTQQAADPDGNTADGDYELEYTAQAPFSFPGGGLIIRFNNPGGDFATDVTSDSPLSNMGSFSDASGFFVGRFYSDADGLPPYDTFDGGDVAAFRLTIADPLPAPPPRPHRRRRSARRRRRRERAAPRREEEEVQEGQEEGEEVGPSPPGAQAACCQPLG